MDVSFDRGEVDRASLDATERLRARLSSRPPSQQPTRGHVVLPWAIAGGLFVFAAGMIANPWFEASVRQSLPFARAASPASGSAPANPAGVGQIEARLAAIEARGGLAAVAAPMPAERLARTEAQIESSSDQIAREIARIDKLTGDLASLATRVDGDRTRSAATVAAATAAADRAQAMLTLLMARRAVEAGRAFGPIDPALRRAFEARYPEAVKAVAALGAAPVTLAGLQRDLAAMGSMGATAGAARQSWWQALTGTITAAVSGSEADSARAPMALASAALARGDVAAASGQLGRLPAPRPAAVIAWLAAAQRWQAGQRGLATLETATLLSAGAGADPI